MQRQFILQRRLRLRASQSTGSAPFLHCNWPHMVIKIQVGAEKSCTFTASKKYLMVVWKDCKLQVHTSEMWVLVDRQHQVKQMGPWHLIRCFPLKLCMGFHRSNFLEKSVKTWNHFRSYYILGVLGFSVKRNTRSKSQRKPSVTSVVNNVNIGVFQWSLYSMLKMNVCIYALINFCINRTGH